MGWARDLIGDHVYPGWGSADSRAGDLPCWCEACEPNHVLGHVRMILCPTCGNKRCPKAAWHGNVCTHSNEPGQPGSNY